MRDRDTLGNPEEEGAASSSTQTASGLGGGAPEGRPSEGRQEPRGTEEPPAADRRQQERRRDLDRRAPADEADNSADDGALRTDF